MLSQLGKLIPYGASLATNAVEWVVMGMFLLSYFMSWVLLVVGPLRPYSTFTRRGDTSRRVSNFLSALGALVMLHVFLAFQIGTSGS